MELIFQIVMSHDSELLLFRNSTFYFLLFLTACSYPFHSLYIEHESIQIKTVLAQIRQEKKKFHEKRKTLFFYDLVYGWGFSLILLIVFIHYDVM